VTFLLFFNKWVDNDLHVSGIAAGTKYGVAKQAGLVAVKVLSDAGYVPVFPLFDSMAEYATRSGPISDM